MALAKLVVPGCLVVVAGWITGTLFTNFVLAKTFLGCLFACLAYTVYNRFPILTGCALLGLALGSVL